MADSQSPWGRKPGGGAPMGGDDESPLTKWLREAQGRMRPGGGSGGGAPVSEAQLLTWGIVALLFLWMASGIYRVNSDELGVVLRFGQYARTDTPGLNYHLPYPIEQVLIPSVTTVNRVEVGGRAGNTENPNVRLARAVSRTAVQGDAPASGGLMLTGDRNVVDIDFEVQWKIDTVHPERYLFNMRNPQDSIRIVAESAMREVIGRSKLDDVLTGAQSQIAEDTRMLMQQMFDEYAAGVEIIAVNLSRPDVPSPVIDEFQDVKRAEQDKQTAVSVAEGYRNEILPRAKGDAAKMLEDAAAYKSRVVAEAEGDAARFKQIYAEYSAAKDVTRRRIYLETMEAVLKGMPKVVLESAGKAGGASAVLPLFFPGKSPPAAVSPVTPPAP